MAAKTPRATAYAIWPTAWGPMGAAMGQHGICRVIVPHYQADQLRDLLAWEHPGAVYDEAPFGDLIALSRDYFNAKAADLTVIPCQMPRESSFAGKVLRACRAIPYGQTRSYHLLAEAIGRGDAARAVAAALGKNLTPLVVPCHRVTYADGRPGGFGAAGGEALKRRLLELERSVSAGQRPAGGP